MMSASTSLTQHLTPVMLVQRPQYGLQEYAHDSYGRPISIGRTDPLDEKLVLARVQPSSDRRIRPVVAVDAPEHRKLDIVISEHRLELFPGALAKFLDQEAKDKLRRFSTCHELGIGALPGPQAVRCSSLPTIDLKAHRKA